MQDPYIETFSAMSARLDELGAPHDTDLPITLLAQLMSQVESLLSEDESHRIPWRLNT